MLVGVSLRSMVKISICRKRPKMRGAGRILTKGRKEQNERDLELGQ